MLDVKIDSRDLDRKTKRIIRALNNPRRFMATWGQAVARKARRKAFAKSRGKFWRDIGNSVKVSGVGSDRVVVTATHFAAAHKQFGGTIRPKRAKALTIPVADEAKGKTAGDFALGGRELFVIPSKKRDTAGILGYATDEDFHPLFILRTKASQKAEPWWPTPKEVSALGLKEAQFWLNNQILP